MKSLIDKGRVVARINNALHGETTELFDDIFDDTWTAEEIEEVMYYAQSIREHNYELLESR